MKRRSILCLDFDGVIHSYTSGWHGADVIPDPPVPGALEFIVRALEHFEVHILSSRSHQWGGKRAMKRWLREHLLEAVMAEPTLWNPMGIPPTWTHPALAKYGSMEPWPHDAIAAVDGIIGEIRWPWFKPPAMLTLDDRAMTFTGQWPELASLLEFKPWNK